MIHLRGAKGQKDRYTTLSEVSLEILREYWKTYRPKDWLFPGTKDFNFNLDIHVSLENYMCWATAFDTA